MKVNLSPSMNAKPTVLLVDDDRLILTVLTKGLTSAGYQVSSAESVDDTETLLMTGEQPDIIILDVNMPGRSGLELATRLSTVDLIPFIMLTAYSDTTFIEQATVSGALSYLVKPIDVPQLIPAIEAAWARSKDIKKLRDTGNQLQVALSGERDISIAIGITMVQYRIDRRSAFEMLRKTARDRRRKLADLALDVIKASEMLNLGTTPKNSH